MLSPKTLDTVEVQTKYGPMTVFSDDMFITKSLDIYGEYCEGEPELWRKIVKKGDTVIDVGANIGASALPLLDMVGEEGHLIAVEPQTENAELLNKNLSFSPSSEVWVLALGASDTSMAVPSLAELGHTNFGRIILGSGSKNAEVTTLDEADVQLTFIKIDVEGMEADVLRGAKKTIARCRPIIYLENDRPEKSTELLKLLREYGYRIWDHTVPLFRENNHNGIKENFIGNYVAVNALCIPKEKVEEYRHVTEGLSPIVPSVPSAGKTGWACVVRLGGVGDNLIAASVLRPLKAKGYKIEVISQAPQHVVFENNPFIDKLAVKNPETDLPQGNMLEWQKYFDARSREYDMFANLSHSCEGALVAFPAMTSFWWPPGFRRKWFDRSYIETVHDIMELPHDFGPLFFPTDEEIEDAQRLKRKTGNKPVISWCLNGTRIDKVYPFSPMAIARLIKELDVTVVVLGAPAPAKDAAMALQIQEHVIQQNGTKDGLFTSIGDAALPELSWPLRRSLTFAGQSDLVIGPDTGTMWSVAFEEVPKIMLHSHASVKNIVSHWKNTLSLIPDTQRVPCWPCHRLHDEPATCVQNKEKNGAACISDITVETIVRSAATLLNK